MTSLVFNIVFYAGLAIVAVLILLAASLTLGAFLRMQDQERQARELRRKTAEHEAAEGRARTLEDYSRRYRAERFEREARAGLAEIPVAEPKRSVR